MTGPRDDGNKVAQPGAWVGTTLPLAAFTASLPPRHPLGAFPSPLVPVPALAERLGARTFLVKRDDLSGPRFGGNKLRALEWLLPTLGDAVVTLGGYGSTWCAALAATAGEVGAVACPALAPQPWTDTVAGVLSTTTAHGQVTLAGSELAMPLALVRAWLAARRHGRVSWLPAGGASPLAVLGSANAALEFMNQVEEQGHPRPDAVLVPVGSCGTAAGLLLGLALGGWRTTVIGVRVAAPLFANAPRVGRLARGAERLLRRHGLRARPALPPFHLVPDQLGAGYGHPTAPGRAAQAALAEAGLRVDLTYGAKCCAAAQGVAPSFPHLCFWHTFDARLMSAPATEHPIVARAQRTAEALWPHPKST